MMNHLSNGLQNIVIPTLTNMTNELRRRNIRTRLERENRENMIEEEKDSSSLTDVLNTTAGTNRTTDSVVNLNSLNQASQNNPSNPSNISNRNYRGSTYANEAHIRHVNNILFNNPRVITQSDIDQNLANIMSEFNFSINESGGIVHGPTENNRPNTNSYNPINRNINLGQMSENIIRDLNNKETDIKVDNKDNDIIEKGSNWVRLRNKILSNELSLKKTILSKLLKHKKKSSYI